MHSNAYYQSSAPMSGRTSAPGQPYPMSVPAQTEPSAPPDQGFPPVPQGAPGYSYADAQVKSLEQMLAHQAQQIQNLWAWQQNLMEKDRHRINLAGLNNCMGIIKYPWLMARTGAWIVELTETQNNAPYATTVNTVSSGTLTFNQQYTFLKRLTFWLLRTSAPDGTALPVGCLLPLSCRRSPFVDTTELYIGKDFYFQVKGSTERYVWQSGLDWRTSWDADNPDGFVFDAEYETVPNDTIEIQALPMASPVAGDAYRLFAALHGYVMERPREGIYPFVGKEQDRG